MVTGSNKGIGFAIVQGLCLQFLGDVYLTSRDIKQRHKRGRDAVQKLEAEGLSPKFHQLDIASGVYILIEEVYAWDIWGS